MYTKTENIAKYHLNSSNIIKNFTPHINQKVSQQILIENALFMEHFEISENRKIISESIK